MPITETYNGELISGLEQAVERAEQLIRPLEFCPCGNEADGETCDGCGKKHCQNCSRFHSLKCRSMEVDPVEDYRRDAIAEVRK